MIAGWRLKPWQDVARPLRRTRGEPTMEQVMARSALILVCLATAAPAAASAGPFAGAPRLAARVEVAPGHGLVLRRPDLLQAVDGLRIHGAVCRAGPQPVLGPVDVHVERLDPGGRVVAETSIRLADALSARDRACGFYDAAAAWSLAPSDTIRVCADVAGRSACKADHAAD